MVCRYTNIKDTTFSILASQSWQKSKLGCEDEKGRAEKAWQGEPVGFIT